MSLGKRIREYRVKRGLTQMQLATKLQMSEANISSYERDKSAPPSDKLSQLAELLGVSSDYLLAGSVAASPSLQKLELELSEEQILTLAAHRIGHEGPLTGQELEQIKLALRIALAKP
ncbi:helix-turn-helix domain-containing protein [Paenibacillus sp. B01]|uniref:helix-turn-helix domain-containing protein n=1 Tax=Paenibacillus sp. B01 TaxID=2660554 RepID=UPI00129C01C7|nr:helix-turn-helix transcriptional regulator [Paenibacillus sp. B01]QGG57421.1 helix-turn-helix domain-containing protein [Paenibacillus sp. B01]